ENCGLRIAEWGWPKRRWWQRGEKGARNKEKGESRSPDEIRGNPYFAKVATTTQENQHGIRAYCRAPLQPVIPIQRRDLISLGQGRVVHHVIDEVLDRAAVGDHRLAQVDQLGCALADDVDAQELKGLAVKDQFEHAFGVAHDVGAGGLTIDGMADLVGDQLLGPRLFRCAAVVE